MREFLYPSCLLPYPTWGFFPPVWTHLPVLVLLRASFWLHPLKHTKFLPWKFSFPAVLTVVREVSLPTFFLGIHCSHLFLSYLNTTGLIIFKSSHMLIFFFPAGQDFICSCLLSRLPTSIYSNRKFFFFFW